MAVIKCKMCGGDLVIEPGATVAECEYCGSRQTVPNQDSEKELTLFARANRLRASCEFDKAAGIYESIVAEFPQEAEAYWGLVLCKYGIEYVDDPATGKKIPTCHRSSFESVLDDSNFDQALENADVVARKVYREEAKQIEGLRKGIIEVSAKEEPYDIFICYKETDGKGDRTLDSVLAQDIYDALTEKGYRVFFSRITLEDKLGQEYEPYIFAALNSAKILLAVGTDYEYYNAVWVKNEWSRYLMLMAKDRKKHLIPCYKNIDAYDMPKEFAKLQAQDMGKVGAMQDLLRGIEKILPLKKITNDFRPTIGAIEPLLKRAFLFLDDAEWKEADAYAEKVLDMNPENSQAYIVKYLAEAHLTSLSQVKKRDEDLYENRNYTRAIQFATGKEKADLEQIRQDIKKRKLVMQLITRLKKYARERQIAEEISSLLETPCVESYQRIAELFHQGIVEDLDGLFFTNSNFEAASRKVGILSLLENGAEYSIHDIQANDHFRSVARIDSYLSQRYIEYELKRDIAELIRMGCIEVGLKEETYCITGSRERRRLREKQEKYERGINLINEAGSNINFNDFDEVPGTFSAVCNCYDKAIDIFTELGDYEDAERKREECIRQKEELLDLLVEKRHQRAMAEEQQKREKLKREIEDLKQRNKTFEDEKHALQVELNNLRGIFTGKRRKEILKQINDIENEQMQLENELRNVNRASSTKGLN